MNKWINGTNGLELDPHINGLLILDKGTRQFNGERNISSTNGTKITEYSYERLNINLYFSNAITDLKWIIDLNVRTNTINLL